MKQNFTLGISYTCGEEKKDLIKIEELVFEDSKLGTIRFFRYDDCDELISEGLNIKFGKFNPSIEISIYKEEYNYLYLEALRYIYENQDEILDNYYKEAVEVCNDWGVYDEDGNSITITYEYASEDFKISEISLYSYKNKEVMAMLWGYPSSDLLGGHGLDVSINCTTKEIKYLLQ